MQTHQSDWLNYWYTISHWHAVTGGLHNGNIFLFSDVLKKIKKIMLLDKTLQRGNWGNAAKKTFFKKISPCCIKNIALIALDFYEVIVNSAFKKL